MENKLLPCKCGATARLRNKEPYIWIECKKKCGVKTGSYRAFCTSEAYEAEEKAIEDWNRMVSGYGKT